MKKILLVDDEPAVLFALSEALVDRRRGIQVVTATDGREAMAVLEAQPIHLVVTDLRMPDVDGFELLAHLRRNYPSLPVILMTALGTAEMTSRLAAAGAFECLSKPFDIAVLKRKIHDMLAQRVRGRVENISLSSFLQLLEIERKTCTLHVTAGERAGRLFFRTGKLVAAETGDLTGTDAALEIVSWEHADIEIAEGCPVSSPPLPGGLAFLLMEGMRLKDEHDHAGETLEDDLDVLLSAPTAVPPPPPAGDPSEPVREALDRGREVDGALATLLAKVRSGGVMAAAVGNRSVDLEAAAAGAAALARHKGEVEERMGLREALEELLWTTARHLYLLRPLGAGEELFLLMILDRRKADLSAAQAALASIAENLAGRVAA
jgi:DNA-binding response OmpR family regulator